MCFLPPPSVQVRAARALLESMRGACSSCWPSHLLGPPSSPVVPNASFMPTPEQCDAASSSWGRAAPHWLTDKIARRAGWQQGGSGYGRLALWGLLSAPDHTQGCAETLSALVSQPAALAALPGPIGLVFDTGARTCPSSCLARRDRVPDSHAWDNAVAGTARRHPPIPMPRSCPRVRATPNACKRVRDATHSTI